jgi:hypothetical protein
MWGQTYFGGLVCGLQTTRSGGLAKLVWTACILKSHNIIKLTTYLQHIQVFYHPQKVVISIISANFLISAIFPEGRNAFGQTFLYFEGPKGSQIHCASPTPSFMRLLIDMGLKCP